MSSIKVAFSTPQDAQAIAAKATRPALSPAIAAAEKPPRSFASAAAPAAAAAAAPAAAKELTPEQIARDNTALWLKEMRSTGNVIGFFYVNPTRKEIETTPEGKIPSPANRRVEQTKKSILAAVDGAYARVVTRDGKSKDGHPVRFKVFYVAMPMSDADGEVFKTTPLVVTEPKFHSSQTWTTEVRIKCYEADLPKVHPAAAAKACFADAPAPDVDLGKTFPAEFNEKMRMPRCYGALWNVPPGGPHGNGQWCAKSGKGKGHCKYNREYLDAVAAGKKTTHGPCKYNHGTLEDAGVTPDNYNVILNEWPLAVARQKAHMAEEDAKAAKAAKHKKEKAALRAQAAADEDGFETAVSGPKSSKPITKAKPAAAPKAANPFAGLEVEESDDDLIEVRGPELYDFEETPDDLIEVRGPELYDFEETPDDLIEDPTPAEAAEAPHQQAKGKKGKKGKYLPFKFDF